MHHITYTMDSREDVLRAADVLVDAGVTIETGPHKHNKSGRPSSSTATSRVAIGFEIGAGGYMMFDPDWRPIVWSQAERAKGQAWGLQTVSSFHTYGTPPVPAAAGTTEPRGTSSATPGEGDACRDQRSDGPSTGVGRRIGG